MASEQNQQGADLDRAHSRLDQAVARLERALVQGAGTAAAGTSALQAENDRLRDQARAASAGLDATIARLRRLLGNDMAQVSVTINNRKYDVSCDDGQEAHLARLASYVDKHIGDLVGQVGQIGDARLLVMASLLVADELSDAMAEMDDLKARLATVEQGGGKGNGADPAELAATMDDLSSRIEAIAARLEQA